MSKDKIIIMSNPCQSGNWIYKRWWKCFDDLSNFEPPVFLGVDWAVDSGMNRGDVISRNDNVIEVRFKTVPFN